jgi:hypothetical protein
MGGIYARVEGLPEEIWKAMYLHYLPVGVEADAPPARAQLGKAAVTWAAVSLAGSGPGSGVEQSLRSSVMTGARQEWSQSTTAEPAAEGSDHG